MWSGRRLIAWFLWGSFSVVKLTLLLAHHLRCFAAWRLTWSWRDKHWGKTPDYLQYKSKFPKLLQVAILFMMLSAALHILLHLWVWVPGDSSKWGKTGKKRKNASKVITVCSQFTFILRCLSGSFRIMEGICICFGIYYSIPLFLIFIHIKKI